MEPARHQHRALKERPRRADDGRFPHRRRAITLVDVDDHLAGAGRVFDEHALRRPLRDMGEAVRRARGQEAGGRHAEGGEDADPGVRPSFRQFVAYAAAWEPIPDDGLPQYPERIPPQD